MSGFLFFPEFGFGFAASGQPELALQAVISFGGETSEGDLVQAVAPAWFEIAKMITKDPSFIFQLSPRKLEEMIAGWYEAYGFDEVTLTPSSGDFGRDVIAVKRGVLS